MSKILSYGEALNQGLSQCMERDPNIVVLGVDNADPKRIWGKTKNLVEQFGSERCFSTPIAEEGVAGIVTGMSLAVRPVNIHMRMDFLWLAMNQLINHISKMSYTFAGKIQCPVVFMGTIGKSLGQGPQHSQSLIGTLSHIPGLHVLAPVTPKQAYQSICSALSQNDPTVIIEHRMLYYQQGLVPDTIEYLTEPYEILFGDAEEQSDILLIGTSFMAIECMRAAKLLQQKGLRATVMNPIVLNDRNFFQDDQGTATQYSIDVAQLFRNANYRVLMVDHDWIFGGVSAEWALRFHEIYPQESNKNIARMGHPFTPCPTSPTLEKEFYPSAVEIASKAYFMISKEIWIPKEEDQNDRPENKYKGPF